MSREVEHGEQIRAADLIGTLCLATDLGMAFPFEHGLRTTVIATRLAERLCADPKVASDTFYSCLLSHSGCTTDAHVTADVFGGSLTTHFHPVRYGSPREMVSGIVGALPEPASTGAVRAMQVARRLPRAAREQRPHLTAMCEVAQMLSESLGLPSSVHRLLAYLTDRWDGKGPLRRAKGEEIPLPMRIVHVAVDAALQHVLGGQDHAVGVIRKRAGHGLDPDVANRLIDEADEIFPSDEEGSVWDEVLDREPYPRLLLSGGAIDLALAAMGNFGDLISPYLTGHSTGVAGLAASAATRCRLDPAQEMTVRRAALVHDLGRVAVGPATWQKSGPLTADDWERVRLHPYHTERVLSRSSFLATLVPVAGAHHERLDRSGYHRGAAGSELPLPGRVLAAADCYHAMTEPRPHRKPLERDEAAAILAREAREGRLDADVVGAVLEAAGHPVPRLERPAGLTEREAEVVGLLARGLQTKQIARGLGISIKTADRHIQNSYAKIGVSTRAAATLFAMEHGLVSWGELPIVGPSTRS